MAQLVPLKCSQQQKGLFFHPKQMKILAIRQNQTGSRGSDGPSRPGSAGRSQLRCGPGQGERPRRGKREIVWSWRFLRRNSAWGGVQDLEPPGPGQPLFRASGHFSTGGRTELGRGGARGRGTRDPRPAPQLLRSRQNRRREPFHTAHGAPPAAPSPLGARSSLHPRGLTSPSTEGGLPVAGQDTGSGARATPGAPALIPACDAGDSHRLKAQHLRPALGASKATARVILVTTEHMATSFLRLRLKLEGCLTFPVPLNW